MQPDTIIPNPSDAQSWNRYSYVYNSPFRYTDPSGHKACGDGEEYDCSGNIQDPNQNPHPPKPHEPKDIKDDIIDESKDDDVTLPIPALTTDTSEQSPSAVQTDSSGPNWYKIGAGIGIVIIGALAVTAIIAGIALTGPAAPVIVAELLVSSEVWMSMALIAATGYVEYKGFQLIGQGIDGR